MSRDEAKAPEGLPDAPKRVLFALHPDTGAQRWGYRTEDVDDYTAALLAEVEVSHRDYERVTGNIDIERMDHEATAADLTAEREKSARLEESYQEARDARDDERRRVADLEAQLAEARAAHSTLCVSAAEQAAAMVTLAERVRELEAQLAKAELRRKAAFDLAQSLKPPGPPLGPPTRELTYLRKAEAKVERLTQERDEAEQRTAYEQHDRIAAERERVGLEAQLAEARANYAGALDSLALAEDHSDAFAAERNTLAERVRELEGRMTRAMVCLRRNDRAGALDLLDTTGVGQAPTPDQTIAGGEESDHE